MYTSINHNMCTIESINTSWGIEARLEVVSLTNIAVFWFRQFYWWNLQESSLPACFMSEGNYQTFQKTAVFTESN